MSNRKGATEDKGNLVRVKSRDDVALTTIVKICNKYDLNLDITLLVNGKIVTGTITSGKNFTDAVTEIIEQKNQDKNGEYLANVYRTIGSLFNEYLKDDHIPEVIHLKDATIFDGTITHKVGWWRGLLRSVDGHSIGATIR